VFVTIAIVSFYFKTLPKYFVMLQ